MQYLEGLVVQLGERLVRNEEVAGSNPAQSTKIGAKGFEASERRANSEEKAAIRSRQ